MTPNKVSQAIQGIGPGPVADKLELFEKQRVIESEGFLGRFKLWIARAPLTVLYAEVAELALSYAKANNDLRAREIQGQFYKTYSTMVDDHRELRAFLYEHFQDELARGTALNQPLLAICKGIMLDGKRAKV